jgi:hypothetical protein
MSRQPINFGDDHWHFGQAPRRPFTDTNVYDFSTFLWKVVGLYTDRKSVEMTFSVPITGFRKYYYARPSPRWRCQDQ